jgi:hypothetical protein
MAVDRLLFPRPTTDRVYVELAPTRDWPSSRVG